VARLWVRREIDESMVAMRSLMSGRSRRMARVSTEMPWARAMARKERSGLVVASMMLEIWAGERSGGVAEWSSGEVGDGEGEGERSGRVAEWSSGKVEEKAQEDCAASHAGGRGWVGAGWEGVGCIGEA